MRRPLLHHGLLLPLLLLAAVLAGAALVAPVWADPASRVPATRFTDGHLLGIALWATPLANGQLPALHTPLVGWPGGADLRPLLWPSCLLGALTGAPLALNLTFALVPGFNLLSGWVLGAALGRGPAGRALLGGLIAVNPWVVETLVNGQVEQAVLGGAALQLATAVMATRDGPGVGNGARALSILLTGVVTALTGWAAPHIALAGCLLVGLAGIHGLVRRGARVRWGCVLLAVALGALAVQAYHAPSFRAGVHVFAPKGSDGRPTGLADLPEAASVRGLALPPAKRPDPVFHANHLGFWICVAALAAALREQSARGALAAAGGMTLLALGETLAIGGYRMPLPWAAVSLLAASVAKSMSAYRMIAGAVVALAVAASAGPRRVAIALGLVALAWAEAGLVSARTLPVAAQQLHTDASRAALATGSGAVLDPLAGPTCPTGTSHYLIEAASAGRAVPLLLTHPRAGYAAVPGLLQALARAWESEECPSRIRQGVARWGFTAVVLHHHDANCPVPPPLARCLEAALGPGETADGVTWREPLP